MKTNNKGFSLVELIIVIAIMAILVGVIAPQLLRYVEKSKVTADEEVLNAIYSAVVYASYDPNVLDDPDAKAIIDSLVTPRTLESIMTPAGNAYAAEVMDTLGWSDLNQATYEAMLESAHESNCEIWIAYQGGVQNPIAMWITTTDSRGKRDTSHVGTSVDDIGINICIK